MADKLRRRKKDLKQGRIRMDIAAFWKYTLAQDAEQMRTFFHRDAWVNWHCTNEHFTAEEFIRANCAYPGDWTGEIERMEQMDGLTITVAHVYPRDGSASFHVTSFFRIRDCKILSIDEYWADDGEAPEWRRELRIGRAIR